jgi:hypothetical protein
MLDRAAADLLDGIVLGRASSALPPWCGTSPGRTSSGRDNGRSAFPECTAPCRSGSARAPSTAAFTARTSMPSTCSPGMPNERRAARGRLWAETAQRRAHGVFVVLDDVDHRQLPELGHVEALVDLALVGRAVAEIGHDTDIALPRYLLAKPDRFRATPARRRCRGRRRNVFSRENMCIEPPLPEKYRPGARSARP